MHQQADIGQRPTRQRRLHATDLQFSQRHEQAGRDGCGGCCAAGPIEGADDGREGIAHGRVQAHGCVQLEGRRRGRRRGAEGGDRTARSATTAGAVPGSVTPAAAGMCELPVMWPCRWRRAMRTGCRAAVRGWRRCSRWRLLGGPRGARWADQRDGQCSAGGATPCSRIAGDASFTASAAVFNSGGRTNQVEAPSGCRTKTPASSSRSSIVSGALGMPAN